MAYQNTGKNIVNMLMCPRNTHPLFRTFGLGREVDGTKSLSRSEIAVEMRKWFPRVELRSVEVVGATESGHFEYNVIVKEV